MTRPGIEPIGEHSNRWANVPVFYNITKLRKRKVG